MSFKKVLSFSLVLSSFVSVFCFGAIRSINVFTGVPQIADVGAKYGGFGDIAANLIAAVEMKQRHPEIEIRLLVTSSSQRLYRNVPTSNEIMKIMVPSLNPEKKDTPQPYKGIKVIFLSLDFGPILKLADKEKDLKSEMELLLEDLHEIVPPSDLNINFSHFPESGDLLRVNTSLAIGVEEVSEDKDPILGIDKPTEVLSGFIELTSGPRTLGYPLTKSIGSSRHNKSLIRKWANQKKISLPKSYKPLFIYTSEWEAAQIYIDALEMLDLNGQYVLFSKDYPKLDLSSLPSNVQFVPVSGLPFEVMHAMIYESELSPLVTGDSSLSQAISSANETKSFVYEAPHWKVFSSWRLRAQLAKDLGLKTRALEGMFLNTDVIRGLSRNKIREKGRNLARLLSDKNLQIRLGKAIRKRIPKWDQFSNVLAIADLLSESEEGKKSKELVRPIVSELSKSICSKYALAKSGN
ncbi:MAG: hypothetical protein AB7F43_07940 [Bacteriovoracia bacterium]